MVASLRLSHLSPPWCINGIQQHTSGAKLVMRLASPPGVKRVATLSLTSCYGNQERLPFVNATRRFYTELGDVFG